MWTGTLVFDCQINTQSDTIIFKKTQTDMHRQEEQFNKNI